MEEEQFLKDPEPEDNPSGNVSIHSNANINTEINILQMATESQNDLEK